MSLSLDAIAHNTAKTVINLNILRQIEKDLDIDEKISVLFLIIEDYANVFRDIFDLFQKAKTENSYIIIDYVKKYPENWEDKILEALCILNNREVTRKLRISFNDLDLQYVPKIRSYSKNINIVAKCLYRLCESFNESEQKLLLSYIKSDNSNYESLLDDIDYLELHMLYWMQIKYITISKDEKHNMEKLLKHLKKFENLKIISIDLEKFENRLHVVDTHGNFGINDKNYLHPIFLEGSFLAEKNNKKKIQPINNGLCIIINQIYFGKEYETRFGSSTDCNNLSETFQAFGFKIEIFENLKRKEMLEKIKNISKDHDNKYDCLFLCILSHGYRGGVISSDEKEVSLEEIEKAVCCMELKDVIKIVIIQACQGKTRGSINNCLTIDGLSDSPALVSEDVRQFRKFLIFMSTIQGFVSVRHKDQGSWFIQEVCKILKIYGNQLPFIECVRKIMTSMQERNGKIEGTQVVQLPEIRNDRLDSDFQLKSIFNPAL
ncbi:caspase-8-like isoform X2 [Formica exsecta]|uniref:caspase-8-like isoform X2 n=1 Tax=Formica exsecta TaxID=72781 RepID=UPI0011435A29|nr:caspase-8-like isoform X2 [Formica exsecta]